MVCNLQRFQRRFCFKDLLPDDRHMQLYQRLMSRSMTIIVLVLKIVMTLDSSVCDTNRLPMST